MKTTKRACSLGGCIDPHYGRGFCRKHWERNHKYGNPLTVHTLRNTTVSERLHHYSHPQGECLLWDGYRDSDGYGHLTINGRDISAHRAAYEDQHGPIPRGLVVRHRCDTPACIKVSHLEIGTHADNINDRTNRMRSAVGIRNGSAKLNEDEVLDIRRLVVQGIRQKDLARRYGVGPSTVSRIVRRTHWRHLQEAS